MGKRKELSVAQRGAILYCNQRGDSCRVIAKAVGCHPATVSSTGSLASKSRVRCPHMIKPIQCQELKVGNAWSEAPVHCWNLGRVEEKD